jgi:hypothetical protein
MYMRYREIAERKGAGNAAPKRIIFYRGQLFSVNAPSVFNSIFADGVSEGQFKQVLEQGMYFY